MFEVSVILAVALVGLCFILKLLLEDNWKNKPPGPKGLPVIGNLRQLGSTGKPLEVIQEWREKYGDVVGIYLGQYRVVILSGYETIKDAYSMWEFSGRPMLKPFEALTGGEKRGLTLSEGQAWTEQRRFALRNLRDFGFGKKSMESFIQEDITDLMENYKDQEGKAFVPHRKFSTAMIRSLWNIIAGERFTYGDARFQEVLDSLHSITANVSPTGPAFFMTWIVTIFPKWSGWTKFQESIGKALSLVSKYIEEHKKTFQPDNVRDYIDVYLREIHDTTDPNSSFHKSNGADKHLLIGTLNLFGAGAETTSNTMVWTLLYLLKNPDVQKKLFKEIQAVIGLNRLPCLEDRDSCPYTLAVMEESLRMSSLAPLGVFHNTMEDVTFKGHHIPKDTLIMANLYGVHYDKKVWGDPEVFRPERFLSKDGKKFDSSGAGPIVAFSVGKRACLGEVLARNNYFLYLTSMIQKFEFGKGDDTELSYEASPGLFRNAQEFKVLIREREVK